MRTRLKQIRDTVTFCFSARKRGGRLCAHRRGGANGTGGGPGTGDAGLTLVEMIVVLVIIALVAALIVPNVMSRPDQARVTTTTSNLATIASALTTYRLDNGDYPTTEQGLKALIERPTTPPAPSNWIQGGYLNGVETDSQGKPADPWGHAYLYTNQGGSVEIKSLGADGKPSGEGVDADIRRAL